MLVRAVGDDDGGQAARARDCGCDRERNGYSPTAQGGYGMQICYVVVLGPNGVPVQIVYRQWWLKPAWIGTAYEVQDIEPVKEQK